MIAKSKSVFQKEWGSQTTQFAFTNDSFAVSQKIGFIHEMCRQENNLANLQLILLTVILKYRWKFSDFVSFTLLK